MKYTMLGLLHYYDGTRSGDKETVSRGDKALIACRKLCDYLIRELGPDGRRKRQLWESGNWSGMASSSVLEPVVWLYKRTSDARYLEFARYIVDGMSTPASGPRLIDLALKGVSVADRNGFGNTPERHGGYVMKSNRWKAYEMMSCYQGLLEYYEVTGQKQVLDAVLASALDIVREEVNLAGGCSCSEAWFHGAHKQTRPYRRLQETCVTVTWMRLCEKLLDLTKDAQWADQIERTFYNAYLAALKSDGAGFAGYTPLSGYRYHGQHHCHLHMDCCTANGPRGFLPIIERMFSADDSGYTVNFYSSALLRLSFNGKEPPQTAFEMYSLYPRDEEVRLVCHVSSLGTKSLRLRMPKWCSRFDLKVNGAVVGVNRNGGYAVVRREWTPGDVIDLKIGMPVVAHVQDHHVAFTRGPILLARDSRLEDVLLSEPIRRGSFQDGDVIQDFVPIRTSSDAFWMQFYGTLPMASHDENPEGRKPRSIRFCDYASAGNLWSETNGYQTWFPFELAAHE